MPVVADGVVYTFGAQGQLHAVDLAKGTRLWSEDTTTRFRVAKGFFGAAGSPLVEAWASDEVLSNHYATSVQFGGFLYGYHGRQEFGPSFRAVEMLTGKVRWSQERFLAGSVMLAGDRLLILREGGELVLAAASPDAFRPLARAQMLPAVVRAFPALADGFLYARNENTLVSLDLRKP